MCLSAPIPNQAIYRMAHDPRPTSATRLLLQAQHVAALGTLADSGAPMVSMVPFAVEARTACLVSTSADSRRIRAICETPRPYR